MKEKRWSLQEKRCRRKKFLPEEIEAGGYFTDTELNYTITKTAAYVCSRQESPSPVKTGKRSKSCDRISRNKTDLMNHETSLKECNGREKGKKVQKGFVNSGDGEGKSAAVVYSRQQSPSPAKVRKKLKSSDRTSRKKKDKPDFRNQEASLKESPSHDTGRKVQGAHVYMENKERGNVCSRQKSPSPVKNGKRSKSCDWISREKDKPDFMIQETSIKERAINAKDKGQGKAEKDKSTAKVGKRSKSCDKVSLKIDESNFTNRENSTKASLTYAKGKDVRKRLVGKVYGNEALPVKERHKCNHCDKTFIYLQSLRKHIFGKHQSYLEQLFGGKLFMSDGNKPETGEVDCHIFAKELGLLNNKPLRKCTFPNCGKNFLSAGGLLKHHRSCHSESASYKCKLCSKRYLSSYVLKMHEVSDHGLPMKSLATETHLNNCANGTSKSQSLQKKTVRFLIPSYHSRIKSDYIKKKMQNLRGILKLPKREKCTSETAENLSFQEVSFTPSQHQPVTPLVTNKEDIVVSGESDSSCDSYDVLSPFQALLSDKQPFLSSKHSSQKHPEFRKDNVVCCHSHKSGSKFPFRSAEKSDNTCGSNVIQSMPGESQGRIPQIYAVTNFHSDQTFAQKDTKQSAVGFHDCVSSINSEKDSSGTPQDCVSVKCSEEECCQKVGYTSDHYSSNKSLAVLQQELSFIRELRSKKNKGIYSSKSGTENRKKRASNTIFKVSSEVFRYNSQTDFRVNDAETRSKYWTADCTKNMTRKVLKTLSKKLSHNLTSKTDSRVKSAKAKLDSRTVNENKCMNVLNSSLNESSHNLSVVHNTAAVEDQANNAVISDNKSRNIKSKTGKKNNPISIEVKCKRSLKNKEDFELSLASATNFKKNNMPIVHSLVDIKSGRVKIPGKYSHKFLPIVMLNKLNLKNYDPWRILHIDDGNGTECAGVLTKEEDNDLQQSLRCNWSALDQDEDRNSSDSLDLAQSLESVASRQVMEGSDDDKIDKVSDTEMNKDILPSNEILNNCIAFTNQSVKKMDRQPHRNVALAKEHETHYKNEQNEKKTNECHNSKTKRGSELPCSKTIVLLPEVKNRKDTDSNKKEKDSRENSFLMKKNEELSWKSQDIVTEMASVDVGSTKQTKFESSGAKRLSDCILITNTSEKKKRSRKPQRSVVLASGQMKHDEKNKKRDDCHNTETSRGSKSPCRKIVSLGPEVKHRNITDTDKTKIDSKETSFFKTSGDHNLETQEIVTEFSFQTGTAKQTNFESSFDISQTSQSNSIVCDQIESSQGKETERDTSIFDANETLKTPYRKAMKKDSKIKAGKLCSRVVVTRNNNDEPTEKVKTVKKNIKTGTVTNKSQNNSLKEKPVDENLIIEEKQNAKKLNKVSYKQKTNSKDLKSVTGKRDCVKSKLSVITENDGETKIGNRTRSRSIQRIHSKFLTSECFENDSSDEEVLLNFKNNIDTNDSNASDFCALALHVKDKSQELEKRFLPLLDSSADSLNSITFFEGSDSKKSDENSSVGQNYMGSKVSSDSKVKNKMNKTIECNNSLGSATSFEEKKDTSLRGKKRKAKENFQTKARLLGVVQPDLEKNWDFAAKTPDFRKELDLTEMDLAMFTSGNSHSIEPQQPNNINNEIKVKVNAPKKSLKVTLKTNKKCSKDVKYTNKSCKDDSRLCMRSLKDLLKTKRTKITKSTKQAKPKLKTSLEVTGSLGTHKRLRQNNNSNKSKLKKSMSKVLYLDKTLHTSHSLDPDDLAAKDGNSETIGKVDNMKLDNIDRNPQNERNSGRSRKLYERIANLSFISKKDSVNCTISESAKDIEHKCFETKNGDEVPKNRSENARTKKTGMCDANLEKQKKPQITKLLIDETQPDHGDMICADNIVWKDETNGLSSSSFRIFVPNNSNPESKKEMSPVSSEESVPDMSQENESSVTFEKLLEKVQPFHPENLVSLVNIKDTTELAVNDSIQQSKSFEYEEEDDMETELDLTVLQQTTPDKQTALDGFTSSDLLELICLSDYQLELLNQISSKAEQEMREEDVEKGNGNGSKEGISSIKTDTNLQSNSQENMNLEEADVCSPASIVCQSYVYKNQNNLTFQNPQTKTPEKEQNTEMMSDKSVTLKLLNKSDLETPSNTCQSSETNEDLPTDLDASCSSLTNLEAVLAKDEDLHMQENKSQHIAQPKGESVDTVTTTLIPQEGTTKNEEVSYKVVACLGRYSEKLTRPEDNHQRFRSTSDINSDSDLATKSRSKKKVPKKLKIHNVQQLKEYTDKSQESSQNVMSKKHLLLSKLLSCAPLVPFKPFTAQPLSPLIKSQLYPDTSVGSLRTAHSLNSTSSNKVTNLGGTVTKCVPCSSPLKTPVLDTQGLGNQFAGLLGTTVFKNAEHMATTVLTDKSVDYLNLFSSSSTPTVESYDNVVTGSTATDIEVEIVDPSSQHRCELCGNGYVSVALLAKHLKIEHNTKVNPVKNAKSYACQFCNSGFTTKRAMYSHTENFHSDKWTRPQKKDRRAQSRYVCKCGLEYQDKRFHKQHVLHCALSSGCADIENPDQETAEAASFMKGQAFRDSSTEQKFHEQASTFVQRCSEIETDFNTVSDDICQQCGSKFLNLEALLNHQRLCGQKEPSTISSIFESPMKKSFKMSCKNYKGKTEVQAVTNTLPLTEVGISSIIAIDQENVEAMPPELEVKDHTDTMKQKVTDSFIPDTSITENKENYVLSKKMETLVDVYESFVLLYKIPLNNIFCWKSYKFRRCGSKKIQCWKMCNRKVSSGSSIEPCVSHLGSRELKKTAQAYREEQVTDFEKAISRPMEKMVKVKKAKKRDRQSSNDSIQSDPVVENKLHTIHMRLVEPIPVLNSKLASSIVKKEEIKKKSMEDPLFQLSSKHQTMPPHVLPTKKIDAQNSFKLKCFKKTGAAASSNSNEDMFYRSPLDRTFGNNKEKTWSACFGTWGQARPSDSRKDRLLKDLEDTGISLPYSHTSPKAYKAANPGDFMKFKEHDALGRTSLTGLLNRSVDSVFQSTLTSSSLDHLTQLKFGRRPFMDSFRSCSFKVGSPLEADLFDVSSISKDSSLLDEKDTSLDSAIVPSPLAERGRCLSTSTMKDGFIFEGSKLPASFSQSEKYENSTKPRPTDSFFDLIKQSSRETSNKNVFFSEALDQERKSLKLASTNVANSGANRKRSWKKRPSCLVSGKESDKKRRRLTRFNMDEDSHDSMETTSLTSESESSGRIQISDEKQTEKISVELQPAQQDCGEIQACRNTVLRDSLKSQALNSDEEDFEDLNIRSAECSQIDELDESFMSTIHFTASSSHPVIPVKRPPYESAERMCNRVTKSPPFSSNSKETGKDQNFTLIDVTESGKSNGLDDVEKFEPDYADDIEESSVKNDTLDSDDCRVSCCVSERISKSNLDQELKTYMDDKACSRSGNEQNNTEVLQNEIFQGKTRRVRSESLEVVTEVKGDLNSEAGEFEVVQVEQNERETSKRAENVEKFDCEEPLEEKTGGNGLECEGDDEDALSIYASSEASFLDDTVEEEEQPQLKSRTPSPLEEHTNNRTSHGPAVVTEQVVEKLEEITELDNEDQSATTSDLQESFSQVMISVKNSSEERRPRFNADLYPKGCCFHFLAHGRCQKPNCNFSHKQPSQEEMLQHCLKKMKLLRHEGDVERLFTLYEDFRSKEMGHLPPQLLESLYQEAIMRGMVYQSYSLLEDLIRQHCSFVSDRVCMDFIRLCGSNSQHFDMVWNILKTMMALQYLPEGDVLIMTLRGCVDREDWDKLWVLMLKCLDYNGFMIPVTFQAMALRAFVHQPRRFIEYAFKWLMKEPDSLNKLDKELLLKVASIFDGCGHKTLAEKLRAATKRSSQQVKSRSISPTDEACLQETVSEIDNEIMKENQHKIQTCKLTSNWHYLGRIFADVLTLESLNNSILLDNYTDALEQKTHRQSDPGCVGRAFNDFIATILSDFQEEKNVNVFAKLDIRTLSWIGNNLLLVCFENQLGESGYEVLSTLVKAKIPYLKYKRHEHRNIPFISILIYLQNNDSKGAIGILDAVCWDQFEKQNLGDWRFMLDVLMKLFHYVLEDRSHISARKVLIAILEQSKKACRFTVDINSHLHFQEYFNALLYCSLKVGDIDSALETYKLHESSIQLQPIDPLLLRAIVIGLVRSQHMIEAKDFFERCKAIFLYENQSIVRPFRVKLNVTYNPEEIYLSVHDYLCCLYNYCCDQVYERKILTQEDLDLEILVQGNVDQQLFSMPYISGAPRSYHLAVKMIRRILQLEFKPSLETNIIAPDRIQISPNSLEIYLKEYDQKFGRRQGLMFKNVLHMPLPLMPAPRVPRPGPRAFRGHRGVNRAEQSSFRIGGRGHIKPM